MRAFLEVTLLNFVHCTFLLDFSNVRIYTVPKETAVAQFFHGYPTVMNV